MQPVVNLSPPPADEVKATTCYMCACRCGIHVHIKGGAITYIEGNRDHPVNKGVICGKGAAGIMQHFSPARLRNPLLRTGERGKGQFKEISWDEALSLASTWLGDVRRTDPKKLAFFTGRDQSQALTGWWASQFGTPNFAAHGGFCSVNMAAAGLYTMGGSFWEFGEPDWERTKFFLLFGVAEDHASNPIKIALGKLKARGVKIVSVNPVRTGYNAIADEWLGIKPGTDGLFVAALIQELFRTQRIDVESLCRYTNAAWLVVQAPGTAGDGLFARDAAGAPLVIDRRTGLPRPVPLFAARGEGGGEGRPQAPAPHPHPLPAKDGENEFLPALSGDYVLADGRQATPSFALMAERYMGAEYAPERAEAETGIPAATIRRIAAELATAAFDQAIALDQPWTDWTGTRHETMTGRPVSMHAMRGVSAHSNGFHTCRLIHILQILLGSIDCPGGFRYKPPYPKSAPPAIRPMGKAGKTAPNTPLGGSPLGFPMGPEDLLIGPNGEPQRVDKAYSWEAPLAAHGLMHMVITNAATADPYPVDVLFLYMANMSWNSSMNVPAVLEHLTAKDADGAYKIPKIIYSDAYASEMVAYADLILPDTTYLERWDCISLLDRPISDPDGPADAIRQPVVKPDRNVRPFQEVLLDLGARLGLPGFVDMAGKPKYPGGYADYIVNHERAPGIGPLAGWRGTDGKSFGRGAVNPQQLERYIENGAFFATQLPPEARFFKHANKDYLEWATSVGFIGAPDPVILQLYCEPLQRFRLAAQGHGGVKPPEQHRKRIATYFDPLPFWYPAAGDAAPKEDLYPLCAITQRPMHMYHSWGSQNAWLRQITNENRLFIHHDLARKHDLKDDDWVWLTSATGRIKCQVRAMDGVNPHTVWTWNAIGKRSGTWGLDPQAPESQKSFLLNHLIPDLLPEGAGGYRYSNSDPVTGQAAWYDLKVRIEKCVGDAAREISPKFATITP